MKGPPPNQHRRRESIEPPFEPPSSTPAKKSAQTDQQCVTKIQIRQLTSEGEEERNKKKAKERRKQVTREKSSQLIEQLKRVEGIGDVPDRTDAHNAHRAIASVVIRA